MERISRSMQHGDDSAVSVRPVRNDWQTLLFDQTEPVLPFLAKGITAIRLFPGDGLTPALKVTIRASETDGLIRMTLANNGRSISEKEIEEIRSSLRSGQRGQHIGLYNVYNRLTLCKGPESTLEVAALPEGGTTVILQWRNEDNGTKQTLPLQ